MNIPVTNEEIRYKHCSVCEFNNKGICDKCGCIIKNKIKCAGCTCPIKKW